MAPAPPTYAADGPPPSYDEVVKKIEAAVGDEKTPEKYLAVAQTLHIAEISVVADGAKDHPAPIHTDEDKKKFAIGSAKAASAEGAQEHLKTAANQATKAAAEIREVFSAIQVKITEIDQIHKSDFLPELEKHQKTFNEILHDSRMLAKDISQYGKSFDEVTIKFCADSSLDVDARRAKIDKFVQKAKGFEDASNAMKNRFDSLSSDFGRFVGTFGNWAKDKEGELSQQIQDLLTEIGELQAKIARLQTALISFGVVAGVALPAIAVAAALSGPFAPFVAIGGLIALGATAAVIAGLAAAMEVTRRQMQDKENEKDQLSGQLEKIRRTRQELQTLGTDKLKVFQNNVDVLAGYWIHTTADAHEIQGWLNDGADDAKYPEYMSQNINHAVKIYSALATFLDHYADGLETAE